MPAGRGGRRGRGHQPAGNWAVFRTGGGQGASYRLVTGEGSETSGSPTALTAYLAKGLKTWTPANSKSLTLRVTTVMPCTRAVAAMSASITGRGCKYC